MDLEYYSNKSGAYEELFPHFGRAMFISSLKLCGILPYPWFEFVQKSGYFTYYFGEGKICAREKSETSNEG